MIIAVSIVDKHREPGKRHMGSIMIEIPQLANDSHFDFRTDVAAVSCEPALRPHLGKLMSKADVAAMDAEIEGKR